MEVAEPPCTQENLVTLNFNPGTLLPFSYAISAIHIITMSSLIITTSLHRSYHIILMMFSFFIAIGVEELSGVYEGDGVQREARGLLSQDGADTAAARHQQ